MSDLITNYLACWNETNAETRRTLLDQHWSPSLTYVDPLVAVAGADDLSAAIGAVHEQFPGFVFTPVGDVDAHHDQARFQWGLGPADAEPVVIGFDVVVTDADGRFQHVLGFLDRVPG
ncbi:MAG TPA: nuclear transport factor 2 family protein [Mycobacterium sp.]